MPSDKIEYSRIQRHSDAQDALDQAKLAQESAAREAQSCTHECLACPWILCCGDASQEMKEERVQELENQFDQMVGRFDLPIQEDQHEWGEPFTF